MTPDKFGEIVEGLLGNVSHPDCLAPRITLDGTKACRESKDPMLWCEKCVRKSDGGTRA